MTRITGSVGIFSETRVQRGLFAPAETGHRVRPWGRSACWPVVVAVARRASKRKLRNATV